MYARKRNGTVYSFVLLNIFQIVSRQATTSVIPLETDNKNFYIKFL